jgi:hypothetical protein
VNSLARIAIALLLAAAIAGGYRWWNGPERQIRRVLIDVARAVSHEAPQQGLAGVAALAALQDQLAEDVVIEPGQPFGPIEGRDAAMMAAAKIRSGTPAINLEFIDTKVSVAADGVNATVDTTLKAGLQDRAGQSSLDARELLVVLLNRNGRWVIRSVRAVNVLEPITAGTRSQDW